MTAFPPDMPQRLIRALNLVPLPEEGGYFAETYRAQGLIPAQALASRGQGQRCLATAIYYLVTPEAFSALHRVKSTEIFHFYLGDPVEMLQIAPEGAHALLTLGPDVLAGQNPQAIVRRDTWQGTRLVPGGRFALLGCTVSPGFDYADYEHGHRQKLLQLFPHLREHIHTFTNP